MNKWDITNGAFEFAGAILVWLNVRRIYIDRELKGVSWGVQFFFASWGAWNLFYYPALGQYVSFVAGAGLFAGSLVWLIAAAYYTKAGRRATGKWLIAASSVDTPMAQSKSGGKLRFGGRECRPGIIHAADGEGNCLIQCSPECKK